MSGSEVARLLQQIQEEEESARSALHDPAIIAKHAFISQRTENIGQHVQALAKLVGSEARAIDLVVADQFQRENLPILSQQSGTKKLIGETRGKQQGCIL
jgi:hypothetical protein